MGTGMIGMQWIIFIGIAVVSWLVQMNLQSKFKKYSKIPTGNGMTGADVALKMLHDNGIYDVTVTHTPGHLTDHYNPANKTVNLSEGVYNSNSIMAAAVAAHECGHAMQHAQGYMPLRIRGSLVPLANLGSTLAWPLILIGLLFTGRSSEMFLNLGILAFSLAVLFQLVTLPVEFNASGRAVRILGSSGIMYPDEIQGTKKVLGAAALTYVAAAAASILQLLRLVLLFGNRRND